MPRSNRIFFIILGSLCVSLASVGIFIPVLPTTPFLLLAAYFFARSSWRFYTWLVTNRWFGAYIRNYREGNGLPVRHKVITIALLWLSIGSAAIFVVTTWWMRVVLLGIAVGVTIHLMQIKPSKTASLHKVIEESKNPSKAD